MSDDYRPKVFHFPNVGDTYIPTPPPPTKHVMEEEPTWREMLENSIRFHEGSSVPYELVADPGIMDTRYEYSCDINEELGFTAWTSARVYFPVGYDQRYGVMSVPRHQTMEAISAGHATTLACVDNDYTFVKPSKPNPTLYVERYVDGLKIGYTADQQLGIAVRISNPEDLRPLLGVENKAQDPLDNTKDSEVQ